MTNHDALNNRRAILGLLIINTIVAFGFVWILDGFATACGLFLLLVTFETTVCVSVYLYAQSRRRRI